MSELPIVIAGGGIGGLTTAIAIAKIGRRVSLLERAPQFEPIGYGIQLGPNALHTFDRLGLAEGVLSYCSLPEEGVLSDAINAEVLTRLPMAETMADRFGQPYALIHRADLHHVLLEACAAFPQIETRNNFEVELYEDDGDQVTVKSRSGDIIRGSLLVAADGIWSPIRRQLFPEAALPFTSRYAAFRCVCPIEMVDPGLACNLVNLRCGTNFHMIHYPLRGGTLFNLVAVVRVADQIAMDDHAAVTEYFEAAFAGACAEVRGLLPLIDRSRHWPISSLTPLHEWVRGRVALIGDAAHSMVQAMAQGACQAIEDGYVLAKHLASGVALEAALLRYQAERKSRATYTQYRSLYMWELIHATGGWRDLRREKLAELGSEQVLAHLDWLYSAASGSSLGRELEPLKTNASAGHVRAAGLSDPAAASAVNG